MDHGNQTILVIGATGQQGGAATRHLLEDGWHVRALAHHPDTPQWRRLAEMGVELIPGDLLDPGTLERAVEGVYGVYSMQTPQDGVEAEETEGKNIADAAAAAGVRHFVYSSVQGAEHESGPGWVVSKHHIEEHIKDLRLPYTIWRPVTFMENFLRQRDDILSGTIHSQLWPESMTYLIAVDDIGRFVALAFDDPGTWLGSTMAIAGDAMTMEDVAMTFGEILGRDVVFEHRDVPSRLTPPRPKRGESQPARADVAECRRILPHLSRLGDWVEATGWKTLVPH